MLLLVLFCFVWIKVKVIYSIIKLASKSIYMHTLHVLELEEAYLRYVLHCIVVVRNQDPPKSHTVCYPVYLV